MNEYSSIENSGRNQRILFFSTAIVLVVIIGLVNFIPKEAGINFTLMTFWSAILYLVISFRWWDPVLANQKGVVTILDKPSFNVGSGWIFAPIGFCEVITVSSLAIQREFPDEPQNIYRGEMKGETIPADKVPPVRIQFRDSINKDLIGRIFTPEELELKSRDNQGEVVKFNPHVPDDGLSQRIVAEPYTAVRFYISDPLLFVKNIGSEGEAIKQIEDEIFAVLNRLCTRISVGQALGNVKWVEAHMFQSIARMIGTYGGSESWGITLDSLSLKSIYTSHGVNTSISDAAKSRFDKQKTITDAEANSARIKMEGAAEARAIALRERAQIDGRTKGLQNMATKLGLNGEQVVAQEVATSLAEGNNAVIIGEAGIAGLVGIAKTITKGLDSKTTEKE